MPKTLYFQKIRHQRHRNFMFMLMALLKYLFVYLCIYWSFYSYLSIYVFIFIIIPFFTQNMFAGTCSLFRTLGTCSLGSVPFSTPERRSNRAKRREYGSPVATRLPPSPQWWPSRWLFWVFEAKNMCLSTYSRYPYVK